VAKTLIKEKIEEYSLRLVEASCGEKLSNNKNMHYLVQCTSKTLNGERFVKYILFVCMRKFVSITMYFVLASNWL
jgi:hypothetical protein